MTANDATKPKRVTRYVVVDASGKALSDRRPRESGAWANATFKLGVGKYDYDAQAAMIAKLKEKGCKVEARDSVWGRPKSLTTPEVGLTDFLHMRLSKIEKEELKALSHHYTDSQTIPTFSWIIRKLISEKVRRLGIDV